MSNPIKRILIAARNLIQDEKNFVVELQSVDKDGNPCYSRDPAACAWCVVGAISCVVGRLKLEYFSTQACDAFMHAIPKDMNIVTFIRNNPHSEVIATFDRAIAKQPE